MSAGLDAVVLSPGPDTLYYLGRDQGSHERLTALVVRPDADPLHRRADAGASGLGGRAGGVRAGVAHLGRRHTTRTRVVAAALPPRGPARGRRPPAGHARARAAARRRAGVRLTLGRRRSRRPSGVRKDAARSRRWRAVGAANDRVQARIGEWLRPGRTEAEVAADIAAAIVAEGHARPDFVIVGSGPNGASPHHDGLRPGDRGRRPRGHRHRRAAAVRLQLRLHPHLLRRRRRATPSSRRLRGACAGPGGRRRRRAVAGVDRRIGRRRRPRRDRRRPGTASTSSPAPATASGWRCTSSPTSWRGNTARLRAGHGVLRGARHLPAREFGVRIEDIVVVGADGLPRRLNDRPRGWRVPA